MADYLIDTSVLIDALNGKHGRSEDLQELVRRGHMLASCAVTVAEIFSGMRPEEEAATTLLLDTLRYCGITPEVAKLAGRWKYEWARRGQTLSLADTLIAATAVHYGLELITDNVRHYPMAEVAIHALPGR